jgi:hypothetical protein
MPHHRDDFGPWNVERTDGRLVAEEMAAATARKFSIVEESFPEWRKDPEHVATYYPLEDSFAVAA